MAGTVSLLRIFGCRKALEFYVYWSGLTMDREYRFGEIPLYFQVSLVGMVIHLPWLQRYSSPGTNMLARSFTGIAKY